MLLSDSFTVSAPQPAVWNLLLDMQRVAACVPGVDSVTEIGPDTYEGVLRIKVGPIAASFGGQVRFVERSDGRRLVAEIDGQDKGSASFVKATFTGMLNATETGTELQYEVDLALRGRLAQFGTAVVALTARKMTAQFARCLQATLTASGDM